MEDVSGKGMQTPKARQSKLEKDLQAMVSPDASPNYPNIMSANKRSKTIDKANKKATSRTMVEGGESESEPVNNVRLS